MSDEQDNNFEYEDDQYQSEPEQNDEVILDDLDYEATDLLRKDKLNEAVEKFNELVSEALKSSSGNWVCKGLGNIIKIQCKQQSGDVGESLSKLIQNLDGIPKKDAQNALKAAIDSIKSHLPRDQVKKYTKQIFSQIEKKDDENLKLRAYIRLAEEFLFDSEVDECGLLLNKAKDIIKSGSIPTERLSDIKLQMYCLEILYLQKRRASQELITAVLKEAESLSTDVSDSKVKAILKENMGKMYVYEEEYEKATTEMITSFKEYSAIGDPKAKEMLKYAAFLGMVSMMNVNLFSSVEAQIYRSHEDVRDMENICLAFDKRDIRAFNKLIDSVLITSDQLLSSLSNNLKEILLLQNLKQILKSYERVTFNHLSKILKINVDRMRKLVFKLIVEGEVQGKINNLEGYFEKDAGFDNYTRHEEMIVGEYIKYLQVQ